MLSERMISNVVKVLSKRQTLLSPTNETHLPAPESGRAYMMYLHVPFCERLCSYCSYNRYPFCEEAATSYFANLRKEMMMLKDLGYDFENITFGGGTPTVMIDELCETIDLARDTFSIKEVSTETNPNHLTPYYLDKLKGRVERLSVGVQSFNDDLLKQMDRYEQYGGGEENLERIAQAASYFESLSVDMIYNLPAQDEGILRDDLEKLIESKCGQITYHSLFASSDTLKKMKATLGKVDYSREFYFYKIIDDVLAGGSNPPFERRTVWTYNRVSESGKPNDELLVDDPGVAYEEYPAIGSGAISHLRGRLYVNNFSLGGYNDAIESGRMSLMAETKISRINYLRFRFMRQLYDLRLDKKKFEQDFGCSVEAGLPIEMAFMRMSKAFETDNDEELTLTLKGRYLASVIYRQYCISLNSLREQARSTLSGAERELMFGDGQSCGTK
ncbi:MAG: coproporphyrinogen III oxidase family protein [Coriobacteriia bacterium]|nr:coproporphyrinogen III oxidase family protein [Coriobacteriia bacterium]MCL2871357.1 coproporphyrinogen III oxidase family protein [Coriobacteriia bacterium]